jgi:pyruvate/2-oxoacid:ferredoxin oxidoreductase beta subunit/Pyruvate/2-oxoacid:ferredoxin oxidoreductase delta subunit
VTSHLADIRAYVEDFNAAVPAAYQATADGDALAADALAARAILPPGTAKARDFSRLAPTIPELLADRCVGCMACVSSCPDAAILAVALGTSAVTERIDAFATAEADPAASRASLSAHFADTRKYGEVPAKRGLEPAAFGIFVDPTHCKGCGECVAVCESLGHGALRMISKEPAASGRESTLDAYQRDMRFFRSMPPTPAEYRSEKTLADLMLGESAIGYVGGAGSCSGCGEATAIRMLVAATRQTYGPEGMGIVASTGCNTVFGSTYPYNPYLVPWTNSLFENAPADALGIRARWDQSGHQDRRLWVIGGDGAMYDIGFQSLSRMLASGADIKVLVLDTQVYSNTGGQASTATFGGQVTKLSAFGKAQHGKPERRKELGRILVAHGDVFVAQTTAAHPSHFYRAILDANEYPGPAVVIAYAPCQPEHGIADDASDQQARLAVESRAFPLFVHDPRKGASLRERLSLAGNPDQKVDWATRPDGSVIDFVSFARTEGRFAPHFGADGTPSPEILGTQADRLANWRMLQEQAGLSLTPTPAVGPVPLRTLDPTRGGWVVRP